MIEVAKASDLRSILAIQEEAFDTPWSRGMLESSLEHPQAVVRIARRDKSIIGYSITVYAADECELLSIAVLPGYRRTGVASRLSDDIIEEAGSRGASNIFLEVRKSNQAARSFYVSKGYQVIAERKRYYQNGEDALVMRLNVSA